LRKSLQEIEALPVWEVELWKTAFEVFGPLDWRRLDLLDARQTQLQLAKPLKLKECVLFPTPEDIEPKAQADPGSEQELLAMFGFTIGEE